MSEDTSTLSRKDGGIALPDLASAFMQLGVSTHRRWSERASGVRSAIGAILSGDVRGRSTSVRPSRTLASAPRIHSSVATTRAAVAQGMTSQPRSEAESESSRELLRRAGRGTTKTRWWKDGWYYADYSAERSQLLDLRTDQRKAHGIFNFHGLMQARICGDGILLLPDGQPAGPAAFPDLVRAQDTVGDVLEIHWVDSSRMRCRSRRIAYPLPPQAARSFRRLCDILVYNYPEVLAPHDPQDVVRVSPATTDVWRLQTRRDTAFELI
jgi:hypothetical protein